MKICWDTLNRLKYNKNKDAWYGLNGSNKYKYIYSDSCSTCGEPFIHHIGNLGLFCTKKCRRLSEEHKQRIAYSNSTREILPSTRKKMSEKLKGHPQHLSNETRQKRRENVTGINNPNWKGGVKKANLPVYDTYAPQIDWCEEVRRESNNENILQVKCTYCGKWYTPTIIQVCGRIKSISGKGTGEGRFYCSNECKHECPIFWTQKNYKFQIGDYTREVQPELRKMVFERDNYTCKKCSNKKSLQCHHVEGIRWEPLLSADIDMCITVCKKCHVAIHKIDKCSTNDLRCVKEGNNK